MPASHPRSCRPARPRTPARSRSRASAALPPSADRCCADRLRWSCPPSESPGCWPSEYRMSLPGEITDAPGWDMDAAHDERSEVSAVVTLPPHRDQTSCSKPPVSAWIAPRVRSVRSAALPRDAPSLFGRDVLEPRTLGVQRMQARRGAIGREGDDGEARRLGKPGIDGVEVRGIASRTTTTWAPEAAAAEIRSRSRASPRTTRISGCALSTLDTMSSSIRGRSASRTVVGAKSAAPAWTSGVRSINRRNDAAPSIRRGLRLPGPSGKTGGSDGRDRPPHEGACKAWASTWRRTMSRRSMDLDPETQSERPSPS